MSKIKDVLFQLQQTACMCLLNGSGDPGSISFVLYFTFKKQHVKFPFQTTCKSYPVRAGKWRARHPAAGPRAPAKGSLEEQVAWGGGEGGSASACTAAPVRAGDRHEPLPPCSSPFRGGKQGAASSASQRRPGERKTGGPGAEGPRGDPGRATQVAWGKA